MDPPTEDLVAREDEEFAKYLDERPSIGNELKFFVVSLKRRDVVESLILATRTLHLLSSIVDSKNWITVGSLIRVLRGLGRRLIRERPSELVVGNMVRRVLFMLREEYERKLNGDSTREESRLGFSSSTVRTAKFTSDNVELLNVESSSKTKRFVEGVLGLNRLNSTLSTRDLDSIKFDDLVDVVQQGIQELHRELQNTYAPIAEQATEHVHSEESILLCGYSESCIRFLKEAHNRKRKFKIYCCENASFSGHESARRLADAGLQVTVITDSAIFALMCRIDKVFIGAHAALANGGAVSEVGSCATATAALFHKVPVVCVMGLYKLSPVHPHNPDHLVDLESPGTAIAFGESPPRRSALEILAPTMDYVPPHLITLFVTNTGGHRPDYVYRLLSEYFHPFDSMTEISSLGPSS